MTWLPQYAIEVHHTAMSGALLSYLVPVVVLMVFNVITGFALRRGFRVGWLLSGALLTQVAVWALLPLTVTPTLALLSLVVYGAGAGVVPACLFAMPSTIMGDSHGTARAFGVIMTGRNFGVLVGPVLLAQAFELSGDWTLAAPVFAVWTALALVVGFMLALKLHGQSPNALKI